MPKFALQVGSLLRYSLWLELFTESLDKRNEFGAVFKELQAFY